ncbi:MAG: Adenylate and Guanylate cyclase catalytic domain protein [Betaproteobacteria bacterium ADurb.Bin341]|nr:MAG: Adenylate and Guanylate cyclase catalytic domain protein [Betaproteobacteria bacterium ADurb.Bin341]
MVPEQIEALVRSWEARDPAQWQQDAGCYLKFAQQAIALGRPVLAFDMMDEALQAFPDHHEMRYLSALALAKSGSGAHAKRILDGLLAETGIEPALFANILSLAGRIAKDHWSRLPEGVQRQAEGEQSRCHYQRAYELTRDYFPGINAATMSLLTGHAEEAINLAEKVRVQCLAEVEKNFALSPDPSPLPGRGEIRASLPDFRTIDFWLLATLGEACMLLGRLEESANWYRQAVTVAAGRYGDIASMRRQVKLLASRLSGLEEILGLLQIPCVAIFTGHMIDAPDRPEPRFPAHLEPAVSAAIGRCIRENHLGFAYCSAACGADILFIEQMLAQGGEVNIVLPFQREDFIRTSVAFAGQEWVERFERALARAASVSYCVEEGYLGDDLLFAHAGELTRGYALLRAEALETEAIMLAVAEPQAKVSIGGTADDLRCWQALGKPICLIDLQALRQNTAQPVSVAPLPKASGAITPPSDLPWRQREIKTMLFADMVGFSRLREDETPKFFVRFLGAIEREIGRSPRPPVFGNTWGDGLYLVFNDCADGADFALRLRDTIVAIDWAAVGLPAEMNIRIGMHTGPVFRGSDPIIGRDGFFGAHVTRAARIEPVTARGSVYVTEQMAAALAGSGSRDFFCDYLGVVSLAKQYGNSKLYRLRRALETE